MFTRTMLVAAMWLRYNYGNYGLHIPEQVEKVLPSLVNIVLVHLVSDQQTQLGQLTDRPNGRIGRTAAVANCQFHLIPDQSSDERVL